MGGIASAIIIPPSGSSLDRAASGFSGAENSRRVAALQSIAPRHEDAPSRHGAFYPDDSPRGHGRDNREVRQLAIRPSTQNAVKSGSGRALVAGHGAAGYGAAGPGAAGPGAAGSGANRAGLQVFGAAPFASIQFLAQVIGQSEEPASRPRTYHPDGAALGSDAYRRAGAAPPHYPEQPTVFRVAV